MPNNLIVALGGGDNRKVKAAQLLTQTPDAVLLFTGEPEAKLGKQINDYETAQELHNIYLQFGAPGGVIPNYVSSNTIEDFKVIYATMTSIHATHAIIVDSTDHVFRSKMIAGNALNPYFTYEFVTVQGPKGRFFTEVIATIRNFLTLKTGIKM